MQRTKLVVGVVLSVAFVAGLYLVNRYWIAPAGLNISNNGEHPPAPDFTLASLKGGELSLADFKGKVVLLNFWATWCGPCREEVPDFVKLVDRYGDQGLVIMGISMDDGPEPVHEFYEEFKMNYPVVMGNAQVAQLYGGVFGIPISFLIGRDGRIYSQHMGVVSRSVIEDEIKELLAHDGQEELTEFRAPNSNGGSGSEPINLGDPETIYSEVPGLKLAGLSEEQKEAFKAELANEDCDCGCGMNLLKCRIDDSACSVSLRLAKQKLETMQGFQEPGA